MQDEIHFAHHSSTFQNLHLGSVLTALKKLSPNLSQYSMLLLYKLNPILSCSFPSLLNAKTPTLLHKARVPLHPKILDPQNFSVARSLVPMKRSSIKSLKLDTEIQEKENEVRVSKGGDDGGGGNKWNDDGGGGNNWNDWVSSGLLLGLWAGLMYYVFQLAPNQTPVGFNQIALA